MSAIALDLPSGVTRVIGALYDTQNVYDLEQDMLLVELPDDIYIATGWYPEWSANGEHRRHVFQKSPENAVESALKTKDVEEVRKDVVRLAEKYAKPIRKEASKRT